MDHVIFEWCKRLPPWHVNALKSIVNADALLDPAHPLQATTGGTTGLAVFAGVLPGGKTRLYMSMNQVEYLRYYIAALKLIDPTEDEVDEWMRRCKEEGLEIEWNKEQGLDVLKRLSLPDSGWWFGEEELADVFGNSLSGNGLSELSITGRLVAALWVNSAQAPVLKESQCIPVTIATEADFKRAMKNAASLYQKTIIAYNDTQAGKAATTTNVQPNTAAESTAAIAEVSRLPPARLSLRPEPLFKRAQASYPLSSAYTASKLTNPGAWLSIDFQGWERECGVVLDVGWAGKWFVQSKDGEFVEQTDGGHWIVQEHEGKLNADMVVPAPEDTQTTARVPARVPYVYGGKSEVLPLDTIKEKVRALIRLMRERGAGGPVHVVVHSADRHIASTALLGLDVIPLDDEPGYASVRKRETDKGAAAGAEAGTSEKVVVFDTSILLAAIINANALTAYPPVPDVERSTWSLARLAQVLARAELLQEGAGAGHVEGNSGNHATVKLECFTTMVVAGVESLRPAVADSAPSVATLSNATISVTATETATEITAVEFSQPTEWGLDLRSLADLQHQTLTAAATATATATASETDLQRTSREEIGLRVFTHVTAVQNRVAQEGARIAAAIAPAIAHDVSGRGPHCAGDDQEGQSEGMATDEYTFQ
ncbi:hypothetical protein QFC22_005463 [Naganishia vaughanmartiniae]|uniref:Uncharacterized protein n=1 Tax=Naganishia vaughanmartiniae TaxID=1424756 RepID=A0ACC2WTP6_9TREE|nr:hypothetical protein QFC22_005463 [Naganishia vaughanmartiniae]